MHMLFGAISADKKTVNIGLQVARCCCHNAVLYVLYVYSGGLDVHVLIDERLGNTTLPASPHAISYSTHKYCLGIAKNCVLSGRTVNGQSNTTHVEKHANA